MHPSIRPQPIQFMQRSPFSIFTKKHTMFQSGKNPVVDEIVQVVESATKAEQKRMLRLLKEEKARLRQLSNPKTKRKLSETEYLLKSPANRRALLKNMKSRRRKVFRGEELKTFTAHKIKSDLKEAFAEVEKIRRGKMKKQTLGDFLNEL